MSAPPFAVFRCDASPTAGSGHAVRCLTLARALMERGWSCGFAVGPQTVETVPALASPEIDCRSITTTEEMQAAWPSGADLAVVDSYGCGAAFEAQLKPWVKSVMTIDDLANRPHECDLLLDSAADANSYDGLVGPESRTLLGPAYALLRPEFWQIRIERQEERNRRPKPSVLVSLGGTDPNGLTLKVLAWLAKLKVEIDVTVILGAACPHVEAVQAYCRSAPHAVTLQRQISDMARRLVSTDIVVGSGGNSAWERCCLGVPTLLILIAENQRKVRDRLLFAGAAGLAMDIDDEEISMDADKLDALLGDAASLQAIGNNAAALCDGLGTARVACEIDALTGRLPDRIRMRPVQFGDWEVLLDWQQDPKTRQWSRNPAIPRADEHQDWLRSKLIDPNCIFSLAERDGKAVGTVRLDRSGEAWEISITVASNRQGEGIGHGMLAWTRGLLPGVRLTAEVLAGNTPSHHLFSNAGYRETAPGLYVSDPAPSVALEAQRA